MTSLVLPAGMNTSLCTRGTPGSTLPSSAINENPAGAGTAVPVCAPTIEGTCMRSPAFTRRTRMLPVIPVVAVPTMALNTECVGVVLSKAWPLIR